MPTTRVNDIELYYEVHGDGPPVLVIPGLGVGVDYIRSIIDDLASTCRVISFDPRGAGQSDKPDEPYSIDAMANDAVGLLEFLGISTTTVVGLSMGGRITLSLALNYPSLVERLVLAATSSHLPPARVFSRRWLTMEMVSRMPRSKNVDAQPRYAWERQRRAADGFDCRARLGEIHVPTLVIHGTTDHLTPFPLGRELANGIAGARLVTLPCGHRELFIDNGSRLVEEVKGFMKT